MNLSYKFLSEPEYKKTGIEILQSYKTEPEMASLLMRKL